MNKRNNKKILEKNLSLFEISILIISIISFSYFVGEEFRLVTAFGGTKISISPIRPAPVQSIGIVPYGEGSLPAGEITGSATEIATELPTFLENIETSWTTMLINAAIATALYFGVSLFAKWVGANDRLAEALGLYISLGYGIGSLLGYIGVQAGWFTNPLWFAGFGAGLIGLGIGALAFLIFYKDVRIDAVQFTCYPWQPVTGGNDCEQCNKGQFPCTEYKCESLGANCGLLNVGTSEEACAWINRNDVEAPEISAWEEELSEGYKYEPATTSPGDKGVIIVNENSDDGCLPAFTRLKYGISLDKPGKCKIDVERKTDFDSMTQFISSGYFKYNHSLLSVHGGAIELEKEGINLTNGGDYEVYVRCESANGNKNVGTFVFKYCVDEEPDTTAPTIVLTEPLNGWFVENGKTSQEVNLYTNKPADCKWSHTNDEYDNMPNTMTCAQSVVEMNANTYYPCKTTLDGIKDNVENKFYFNCKSYPLNEEADRYKMATNYEYILTGTSPLVIDSISPVDGSLIKDATQSVKVVLTAKTSAGYDEGQAYCDFKTTSSSDTSYVLFSNTNSYQHSQDLWLDAGSYDYTIKCCDLAELNGNCDVETVEFDVETDFEAPLIVRAYNENKQLKIITNENAECVYGTNDCNYLFKDGVALTSTNSREHFADWNTNSELYIKCKDEFGNQPDPDRCSITVRPFSSY